eukprot:313372-Rhodomonas_salina.1
MSQYHSTRPEGVEPTLPIMTDTAAEGVTPPAQTDGVETTLPIMTDTAGEGVTPPVQTDGVFVANTDASSAQINFPNQPNSFEGTETLDDPKWKPFVEYQT